MVNQGGDMEQQSTEVNVTITADGANIMIAPLTWLAAEKLISGLEISEMCTTFGTEILAVMPTEIDELIGCLGIRTNNDYAVTLRLLNSLICKLFPPGEGGGEFMGVSED